MSATLVKQKKIPALRFSEFKDLWQIEPLKDASEKLVVGFVGACEKFYTDSSGVPMLRTGNLKKKGIDFDDLKYVTKEFHKKNVKSQLQAGDILIARHGDNGLACIVPKTLGAANCLNIVVLRALSGVLLPEYLHNVINSPVAKRQMGTKTGGSTQKVVNTNEIKLVKIGIPSLPEQQKIADFLSVVDLWIESLNAQKTTLETYKRGMMQMIFSQEIRFKDEKGKNSPEWKGDLLKNLVTFFTAPHVEVDKNNKNGLWFIDMGSVTTTGRLVCKKQTSSTGNVLKEGNLVMPNRDIGHGDIIGKVAIIDANNKYVLGNNMYGLLVNKSFSPKFLYYLINSEGVNKVMRKRSNGTSQLQLIRKDVDSVPVSFPSLAEQQKIADFLSSLDNLIESKQKQITNAEQWKKGLMQKMFV